MKYDEHPFDLVPVDSAPTPGTDVIVWKPVG